MRPSLRSTGPKSRRSGSKAERTGTAPWTTPQLRRAEDAVTGPVGGGGGVVCPVLRAPVVRLGKPDAEPIRGETG